ncbi:MAG: iron donor protein CyaY [Myxococcales bacterium]|nr:iron donor protein CyaY [Myxococcales bacterium]
MTELSEADFERRADATLQAMVEALIAASDLLDPDLQSGVLTITFEDGTKYVVNSHRAARQIWLAAERAAWHFDFAPGRGAWIAAQTGAELWTTVAEVVSRRLGRTLELAAPAAAAR